MTIKTAKEANEDWKRHMLKYYLEFIPAEKESCIANLIDEANGRGVAITTYSVWNGEVYNGRPLANSICSYLNAMGYTTDVNCSAATPDKLDIVIRWDNPKEDW